MKKVLRSSKFQIKISTLSKVIFDKRWKTCKEFTLRKRKLNIFRYYSEEKFRQVTNKSPIKIIHWHISLFHQVHAYPESLS